MNIIKSVVPVIKNITEANVQANLKIHNLLQKNGQPQPPEVYVQRVLEKGINPELFHDNEYCGSHASTAGPSNWNTNEANHNQSGNNKGNKGESIHKFVRSLPTAPLNLIFQTEQWRNSKYKYINKNLPLIKTIMSHVQSEYTCMTMKELSDIENIGIK